MKTVDGKFQGHRTSVSVDDLTFRLFDILHDGKGRLAIVRMIESGCNKSALVREQILRQIVRPSLVKALDSPQD